jgi:hypothetical protein
MIHIPTSTGLPGFGSASWAIGRSSDRRHERSLIDGILYKIADCREEREDAFRLTHDAYTKTGLMVPNAFGMRVTPYHLLPTTDVFVAYHGHDLIYTMTLISDDEMGLPLEDVYGSEIASRHKSTGQYFAEVSCLAARLDYFPRHRMFEIFVRLAGLLVQSAQENGVQRLFIACHPRHARFYQSFLGFEQIADERIYENICNQPAVACEHDFASSRTSRYKLIDRIHEPMFRRWELYHQPMLTEDRNHFAGITEFCNQYFPLAAVI